MSNSQRLIIENVESMPTEELKQHAITQYARMDDGSDMAFSVCLKELESRLNTEEYSDFSKLMG